MVPAHGTSRFFRYEVRCRPWTTALDPRGATTRGPVPFPSAATTGVAVAAEPTAPVGAREPISTAEAESATATATATDDGVTEHDAARRCARAVLDAAGHVPLLVWGRRAPGGSEMWNSSSVVAWLLARAGVDALAVRPPPGGRAPGWHASLVAARTCEAHVAAPGPTARGSAPGADRAATTTADSG